MKSILVPTDFSPNADKALHYAILLANKLKLNIDLVHCYSVNRQAGHLSNMSKLLREDREIEMKELIDKKQTLLRPNLSLKGKIKKGGTVDLIVSEVAKVAPELVVMGTLGASSLASKILGSTTSYVIDKANCPLLAIPNDTKVTKFKKIVVAMDALSVSSLDVYKPLVEIALSFNMEVELLHVSNQKIHTDIDPKVAEYIKGNGVACSYTKASSEDIFEGIVTHMNKREDSLICVMARQRGWFSNLYHSSISKKIAMYLSVPLLVLHE